MDWRKIGKNLLFLYQDKGFEYHGILIYVMAPENQRLMIALTGAGVSITVITMSVYMMVKSTKEIKHIRSNQYGA